MNETKTHFLDTLINGTIPAAKSKDLLAKLPESEFIPISQQEKAEIKDQAYWTGDYFRQLFAMAKRNFSKEICEHLIEVKTVLQKREEKGFVLAKASDEPTTAATQDNITAQSHTSLEQLNQHIDLLKNYVPDAELKNSVAQQNIDAIKNQLLFMLANQRLATQDILLAILYIQQNAPEVFEPYAIKKFHPAYEEDAASWDADYFSYQQSYLNHNFALERLLHLLNVRDLMINKGLAGFSKEAISAQPKSQQTKQTKQTQYDSQRTNNRHHAQSNHQQYHDHQADFVKKVAIIGGAVLAGLVLLFSIFR